MIANHASHLDALAIMASLPRARRERAYLVSAADTFFNSRGRSIVSAGVIGALPMRRGRGVRHTIADLRDRLAASRDTIVIFPEGTRSRDGRMGPFKSGIGALVAGHAVPVVPAVLGGFHAALPPGSRLPRPHKLTISFTEPLSFLHCNNDGEGWRKVAGRLEAAILSAAQPVTVT